MMRKLRKGMVHTISTLSTGSDTPHLSTEMRNAVRLRISLLALLCALGVMALTASIGVAVEQPVVPYQSTGYRYSVVPFNGMPGFELPGFDDSGFSIGDAAFGSGGSCPLGSTVHTPWPLSTDILLRKTFALPAGASAVEVAAGIDNDIQVFINGVDISGGLRTHENCATLDSFIFSVPDAILNLGGDNLLAVRARDRGLISYVDVEVRAEIPAATLSDLSPAKVYVGLTNSDDVGLYFDLLAEVLVDGNVVGSGQINKVWGGSSGFNNAVKSIIPLVLPNPVSFPPGSQLSIRVSVRQACAAPRERYCVHVNECKARLWFNDSQADSSFDATIGGVNNGNSVDYFLLDGFALGTGPGPGPKKTSDVGVGKRCSPFKPFGTWSITIP